MMHDYRLQKFSNVFSLAILLVALMTTTAAAETLEQAWAAALAADHGLKASRDNSAAAGKQLAAAKTARLPFLEMGGDYVALSELPTLKADLLGQSFQIPLMQRNGAVYNATATLPIYTGGRIEHGIAAASSSLQAAKFGESTSEQNLRLRVAEAYVNVLRASRWLQVAESHQTTLEAHAKDVDNLLQQGMAAKNAQLSSQVALLDARQQVLQAANTLDLAHAAYNRLLGRALDQPVVLDEISPESTEDTLPVLVERALTQRNELKAMDRQIAALRNQAVAVRRETVPQVGLSGGYDYLQDRYLAHEADWVVALGVKWNVFDGGSARNRGSAIELQAKALSEQRNDLASVIGLQVRQSWLDIQTTRKRIDVTQSAIAEAEENVRVVRDRYVNGLAPYTEVLDAETLRVNSQTNNANAVYDAVIAGLRLKYAVGEL
jgi:outer membrane protein TolC